MGADLSLESALAQLEDFVQGIAGAGCQIDHVEITEVVQEVISSIAIWFGNLVINLGASLVRLGLMATVLLSVFAHGLSSSPGIRLYVRQIDRLGAEAPERDD